MKANDDKKAQVKDSVKNDECLDCNIQPPPERSEQCSDVTRMEEQNLEFRKKHEITATTRELLKIFSVIYMRKAAKEQQQGHRNI